MGRNGGLRSSYDLLFAFFHCMETASDEFVLLDEYRRVIWSNFSSRGTFKTERDVPCDIEEETS